MTSGRNTSWPFKQRRLGCGYTNMKHIKTKPSRIYRVTLLTNETCQSAGRFYVQQIGDYSTSAYNNTEWQLHNPELLAIVGI